MTILIGLRRQTTGQGFTLIELLLATVLLMLLLGAMVFSYSTLQRGAALEEGTTQFEALLRYAQAQAASTGRKVELVFEEDVDEDLSLAFGNVRVLWEPDPLGRPNQFVALATASPFVERILELVEVEAVHPFDPGEPFLSAAVTTTNEAQASAAAEAEFSVFQPPIVFYPDGSSDSAEITLAARDPDETRRMTVRLIGITGAIQRRLLVDEAEPEVTDAEKSQPAKTTTITQPAEPSAKIPTPPEAK